MFWISCKAAAAALLLAATTAAANDARRVDWDDLYANPARYRDQPVRTRQAQCFAAGPEDFRCASPDGAVLISTTTIIGDPEREILERQCDTVRKASTNRACRFQLRFVFLEPATMDTIGPRPKRLIRAVTLDLFR